MKLRWASALALVALLLGWLLFQFVLSGPDVQPPNAVALAGASMPIASRDSPAMPVQSSETDARVAAEPPAKPPVEEVHSDGLVASTGIRLHGFVLPPEGVHEEVLARVALTDAAKEQRSAVSGPQSGFEFLGLSPGRYQIVAKAGANEEVHRMIELNEGERERELDLRLELLQEILVEIVDAAGQPISDRPLSVIATIDPPVEWVDSLVPGIVFVDVARWKPSLAAAGRLQLLVRPPVFVSVVHGERVVATQRVEPGRDSVRFVLDTAHPMLQDARVRLRLVDARKREPLALRVEIFEVDRMWSETAGADGVISFGATPGRLRLELRSGDWQSPHLDVRAAPGVNDLGDIALEQGVHISGWTLDENGRGLRSQLEYEPVDATPESTLGLAMGFSELSRPDGSFQIGGLSQRRYRLTVPTEGTDYALQTLLVDVTAGSVENLVVRLSRGVAVSLSTADEHAILAYSLWNELGVQLRTTTLRGATTDKLLLAPGRYELEVQVGGKPIGPRRAFTVAQEPVAISLP